MDSHLSIYVAAAILPSELLSVLAIKPTYRSECLESLLGSETFLPPCALFFTNATKCRQFCPSNNFAYSQICACSQTNTRICSTCCLYDISSMHSPLASSAPVLVAFFTCWTGNSGENFA